MIIDKELIRFYCTWCYKIWLDVAIDNSPLYDVFRVDNDGTYCGVCFACNE